MKKLNKKYERDYTAGPTKLSISVRVNHPASRLREDRQQKVTLNIQDMANRASGTWVKNYQFY